MNADAYFVIGRTHAICQDYAEAGPLSEDRQFTGTPRVVLSDGCSSAQHTDYGARFLVTGAKKALDQDVEGHTLHVPWWAMFRHLAVSDRAIIAADGYRRAMGLPAECLCATLLTAQLKDDAIRIVICGDGVIAARERDTGRILVQKYEYPSGAPYYLRYTLDTSHAEYIKQFGFKLKMSQYHLEDTKSTLINEWTSDEEEDSIIGDAFPTSHYDLVALFTDGVHSFVRPEITATSKTEKQVDFLEVVKELLQFKSYNGIFVQRRMRRAFDPVMGAFGKNSWINTDDLSMGVIVP